MPMFPWFDSCWQLTWVVNKTFLEFKLLLLSSKLTYVIFWHYSIYEYSLSWLLKSKNNEIARKRQSRLRLRYRRSARHCRISQAKKSVRAPPKACWLCWATSAGQQQSARSARKRLWRATGPKGRWQLMSRARKKVLFLTIVWKVVNFNMLILLS